MNEELKDVNDVIGILKNAIGIRETQLLNNTIEKHPSP